MRLSQEVVRFFELVNNDRWIPKPFMLPSFVSTINVSFKRFRQLFNSYSVLFTSFGLRCFQLPRMFHNTIWNSPSQLINCDAIWQNQASCHGKMKDEFHTILNRRMFHFERAHICFNVLIFDRVVNILHSEDCPNCDIRVFGIRDAKMQHK